MTTLARFAPLAATIALLGLGAALVGAGPKSDPKLLAPGTQAPGWTLKSPTGEKVSLADLQGNIVLLDFWATWCGPCKKAMPGVQKIHERFSGRPVKVYGISVWEQGDPADYMVKKNFTYGLLVEGDKVATDYKVAGIPAFYVIGVDGKVIYAATGFSPGHEKHIGDLIEEELNKQQM